MKRLTFIVSFLFLSSLVFASGLFMISAQAQLSSEANLLNADPPRVNAGSDRNGTVGVMIELAGEATDEDRITGLGWTLSTQNCQISPTTPFDINTSKARAVATVVCAMAGEYTATLTAIDATQAHASDTALIVITAGSTSDGTPGTPTHVCGNGVAESTEECDMSDLRGETCASRGFQTGTLSCRTDCAFETSGCSNAFSSDTTTNTNTAPPLTNTNTQPSSTGDTTNTNTAPTPTTDTAPTDAGIAPVVHTTAARDADEGMFFTITGDARDDQSIERLAWTIATPNCMAAESKMIRISRNEARAEITARCLPGSYVATLLAIDNEGLRSLDRTTILIRPKATQTTVSPTPLPTEPAPVSEPTPISDTGSQPGVFDAPTEPSNVTKITPPPPSLETGEPPEEPETTVPALSESERQRLAQIFGSNDQPLTLEYRAYCSQRSITDPERCRAYIATTFPQQCRSAGKTTPADCERYLKSLSVVKRCADEQITAETCEDTLLKRYRPELYCGTLSADDCGRIAKERLLGTIATVVEDRTTLTNALESAVGTHATVNEIVSVLEKNKTPREVLPLIAAPNQTLMVRDSDRTIDISTAITAEATAPFLILIDDDGDGLPNDIETHYGSDIKNSDTDNDGFSDRDEIVNGYDPIKSGGARLEKPLSPVEQAIIGGSRMEQPVTKGEVDATLTVTNVTTVSEEGTMVQRLTGTAEPNSTVLIYIYSRMPLVLTVQTDASGNWVYTLSDNLVEGKHDVYVAVTNQTGQILKKSEAGNFFIRGAQAVSVEDFLATEARAAVQTPVAERNSTIRYYVIGSISIVIFGLALMWFFIARKRANA